MANPGMWWVVKAVNGLCTVVVAGIFGKICSKYGRCIRMSFSPVVVTFIRNLGRFGFRSDQPDSVSAFREVFGFPFLLLRCSVEAPLEKNMFIRASEANQPIYVKSLGHYTKYAIETADLA